MTYALWDILVADRRAKVRMNKISRLNHYHHCHQRTLSSPNDRRIPSTNPPGPPSNRAPGLANIGYLGMPQPPP